MEDDEMQISISISICFLAEMQILQVFTAYA